MTASPMRRVQSARTQQINDIFKYCPELSQQYRSPRKSITNIDSSDQRELIEQRQKLSQQILFTKSQIAPLRQKAEELTITVKNHHPEFFENLNSMICPNINSNIRPNMHSNNDSDNFELFFNGEINSPEYQKLNSLKNEKESLENDINRIKELTSKDYILKISNDVEMYRNSLNSIKDLVQRGKDILVEKRNSYEIIVNSEIYEEINNQRNTIEELQNKLSILVDEGKEINDNISMIINNVPEVCKMNQMVLFLQRRLSSLQYDKNMKREELLRITNNHSSRKSPRAKSRRKMSSDIEQRMKSRKSESPSRGAVNPFDYNSSDVNNFSQFQNKALSKEHKMANSMKAIDEKLSHQCKSLKRFHSNSDIGDENLANLSFLMKTNPNSYENVLDDKFYDDIETMIQRNHEELNKRKLVDQINSENKACQLNHSTKNNQNSANTSNIENYMSENSNENNNESLKNNLNSSFREMLPRLKIKQPPPLNVQILPPPPSPPLHSYESRSPRNIRSPNVERHEKSPRIVRFVFEDSKAQMQ
ncbi:hypothetical protein TRFO_04119 [Tritrichomonas foetus]|uniref:Uncharacterized protein n=1 Tax=Tritrichomonas foetus TaxID=1144522 RepID=A0A1J4KLR3_9EUKA|nr:hypothetical protein TRFO_04119 [Tritrichomonas foetus]|eukprot:OHT10630.1 hypothetical protein TRFO_04119 [Tritrichomonas foetus]